jgi:hypothetical protein
MLFSREGAKGRRIALVVRDGNLSVAQDVSPLNFIVVRAVLN